MAKRGVGYKLSPGAVATWIGMPGMVPSVRSFLMDLSARPYGEDGTGAEEIDPFQKRYFGGEPVTARYGYRPQMGSERGLDAKFALRNAWVEKWEGLHNRGEGYDGEYTYEEETDWAVTQPICGPNNFRFVALYREGSSRNPILVTEESYGTYAATLMVQGIKTLGLHTTKRGTPGLYGCRDWPMYFDVQWLPDVLPEPVPVPDPAPEPGLVHPWLGLVTVDDLCELRPRWILRPTLEAWVQYLDKTPGAPAFGVLRGRYE